MVRCLKIQAVWKGTRVGSVLEKSVVSPTHIGRAEQLAGLGRAFREAGGGRNWQPERDPGLGTHRRYGVSADGGGSHGSHGRLWKGALQGPGEWSRGRMRKCLTELSPSSDVENEAQARSQCQQ
jgi:hypothetical protein